jgi:predicted 2-oxoglutarate/Fe(II)-dependent dioxygenase YbiX
MFSFHMWQDVIPPAQRAVIAHDAVKVRDIGWIDRATDSVVYEKPGDDVRFKRVAEFSVDSAIRERLKDLIQANMSFMTGTWVFKQELLLMGYGAGDTFGWHSDSHSMSGGKWTPTPGREGYDWSIVLYVNSDFEGGNLEFRNGMSFKPMPGALVAFPSAYTHRVTPVVSGHRLAFTTFLQRKR